MKFNTITYERSKKRYEDLQTARVELTVGENEDPITVMDFAAGFVNSQLGIKADQMAKDHEDLRQKKKDIQRDIDSLEMKLAELKQRWEKAKDFLTKHGVSIENLESDIPF